MFAIVFWKHKKSDIVPLSSIYRNDHHENADTTLSWKDGKKSITYSVRFPKRRIMRRITKNRVFRTVVISSPPKIKHRLQKFYMAYQKRSTGDQYGNKRNTFRVRASDRSQDNEN